MRRRFIVVAGELVEVTGSSAPDLRADSGALWSDKGYTNCRATDGTVLDTRTKHRNYMRERGLTTVDDFTNEFAQREQQRAEFYTRAPDAHRAHDIARAWEKRRG